MTYSEFIEKITPFAEEGFAKFQRKLILTDRKILGIRTPIMRKIAKECIENLEDLFSFPDEYYEVVFIKLTAVSMLPYERFLAYLERSVGLMDNWALCDSFKVKGIKKHKQEFLSVLDKLFNNGGEYFQRYVLVVFLTEYVETQYLPLIKSYVKRADTNAYYVHMAVAWLVAEILVKEYEYGIKLLSEGLLPAKTHNKAIQKAIESYRIDSDTKKYLRTLKKRSE
jgi:3-methyladenine DNA glycosylase AlkD